LPDSHPESPGSILGIICGLCRGQINHDTAPCLSAYCCWLLSVFIVPMTYSFIYQIGIYSVPFTKSCYLHTSSIFDIVNRQVHGRTGVQIPAGDFPLSQIGYTGTGAHPASYFIGTRVLLGIEMHVITIRPLSFM